MYQPLLKEPLISKNTTKSQGKTYSCLKLCFITIGLALITFALYQMNRQTHEDTTFESTENENIDLFAKDSGTGGSKHDYVGTAEDGFNTLRAGADAAQDPTAQNIGNLLTELAPALATAGPFGPALGGVAMLTGIFLQYMEQTDQSHFQQDLQQNITKILQNQEIVLEKLDNLIEGQKEILNEVQARTAKLALDSVFDRYKWDGPEGMTHQAHSYKRVVETFQDALKRYNGKENAAYRAKREAIMLADKLWTANEQVGLILTQFWENQVDMLNKVMEIQGNQKIGRWTAAEIYRQYLGLRFMSYNLQMLAQLHRDSKNSDEKFIYSQDQIRIVHELKQDIQSIHKWALSEDGFEYPAQEQNYKSCLGHLSNDLKWKQWEVQQCVTRFGSKNHTKQNPNCCYMFNFQPSGKCDFKEKKAWNEKYYFHNLTKERASKCNTPDEYADTDGICKPSTYWSNSIGNTNYDDNDGYLESQASYDVYSYDDKQQWYLETIGFSFEDAFTSGVEYQAIDAQTRYQNPMKKPYAYHFRSQSILPRYWQYASEADSGRVFCDNYDNLFKFISKVQVVHNSKAIQGVKIWCEDLKGQEYKPTLFDQYEGFFKDGALVQSSDTDGTWSEIIEPKGDGYHISNVLFIKSDYYIQCMAFEYTYHKPAVAMYGRYDPWQYQIEGDKDGEC